MAAAKPSAGKKPRKKTGKKTGKKKGARVYLCRFLTPRGALSLRYTHHQGS